MGGQLSFLSFSCSFFLVPLRSGMGMIGGYDELLCYESNEIDFSGWEYWVLVLVLVLVSFLCLVLFYDGLFG